METYNAFINFALNAGLFGIAGFFIKRWMGTMESRADTNAKNITLNRDIADEELKTAIQINREEYKERSNEIIKRLDEVCEHMEVANGRTRKLELKQEELRGDLKTQIALCRLRNGGRRSTDKCVPTEAEE